MVLPDININKSHINSVIAVMNQRLYLLNQLRKQGLDIRGLTQTCIGLVVARFQYALPAIAGQILSNDLNKIDTVFSKASRLQRTSIVPRAADIVDNSDKKTIQLCPQPNPLLTPYASILKKILTVDVHVSKDMVEYYP